MPVTMMQKPDTSLEVRLTKREVRRIDRYVQHMLVTLPVDVRYSRNSAIRDLLAQAMDARGIPEEPDDFDVDEGDEN